MNTLSNVKTRGGEAYPPCLWIAPETIPEAQNAQTGVSVKYVPTPTNKWYTFRVSYEIEAKTPEYTVEDGHLFISPKRYFLRQG